MKKLFLFLALIVMAVSVSGCQVNGIVKKVIVNYSIADHVNHKMVTKTVTSTSTDATSNLVADVVPGGLDGHYVLLDFEANNPIMSDSAGIWLASGSLSGNVVDPYEGLGGDTKYKTNTPCRGVVRVAGTGTYDPASSIYTGSGDFIDFNGSASVSGTGKWNTATSLYRGVATVKIVPGTALLYHITNGEITSVEHVEATITLPAVVLTGGIPLFPI